MASRRHKSHSRHDSDDSENSDVNDGDGEKICQIQVQPAEPFNWRSAISSLENYIAERKEMVTTTTQQKQFQSKQRNLKEPNASAETEAAINRSIEIFFGNVTNFGTFYEALSDQGYTIPNEKMTKEELEKFSPQNSPQIDFSAGELINGRQEFFRGENLSGFDTESEFADTIASEFMGEGNDFSDCEFANDDNEIKSDSQPILDMTKTTVNPCAVKKLCLVGHPLTSFRGLNSFRKLSEAWITNCHIKDLQWEDFKGLKKLHRLYLFGGHIMHVEPLRFENLRVLWLSGNKLTSLSFLKHGMPSLVNLNVGNNQITCLEAEHLFKSISLQTLNVAGNPLCSIQDVISVNVLPSLKTFYLTDPIYGKCPIASLCESRAILVDKLTNIISLNGKEITLEEQKNIREYVRQRCLYYFANCSTNGSSHVALRKAGLQNAYKQLDTLGARIMELGACSARCLQMDYHLANISHLARKKNQLLAEVGKIHTRLSGLKYWARVILRRVEVQLRISRWEQSMEEWMKWVEYLSYGTIISYTAHSVLDHEDSVDKESIRATLHQLFSSLSCAKPWPKQSILKLETIIVMRDRGAEAAMEKIFEENYSRKNEPQFVPPPPPEEPELGQKDSSVYPFYGPPSLQPPKVVPTYVDPNYKPSPPVFTYPESVPGLPERSQPVLMFIICENSSQNDPHEYFHNLLFEKSRCYKDIRMTNCVWLAAELNQPKSKNNNPADIAYSIVYVVKVLEECILPITRAKRYSKRHNDDCMIFGLRKPLCYAPAYIVYISHTPNDKGSIWYEGIMEDSDVMDETERLLAYLTTKMYEMGGLMSSSMPYYLHRTHDGVKADLTAITKLIPNLTRNSQSNNLFVKSRESGVDLLSVSKFMGADIAESITSLDLSGNGLGLTVGLEGLTNLKKLNLSHNNLTTLSGLHKLPQLRELKAGWNYLRFFHTNINTLIWACSKLTALEVLPNPFQDVRDYAHIPILAKQCLPCLTKVDAWTAPFTPPIVNPISTSKQLSNIDVNFTKAAMKYTWVGHCIECTSFKGKCLTTLENFPVFPAFPEGLANHGMMLDLSDNYLTSTVLHSSPIIQNSEWRVGLVKLQLQENAISSLDWMGEYLFPNLRILNLSSNQLTGIEQIERTCPNLMHLQLCANPLPCNLFVLNPLRNLKHLLTLDTSRSPLSTHPDYAVFVLKYLQSVQILDGVGMIDWNTEDSLYRLGGTLSQDWLEMTIGRKDWSTLTELSLPQCGIQSVNFPPGSLPKLLSLDLSGNGLTSLSGLSTLPNLKVLCVSHNNIISIGDACPKCFEKTTESQSTKSRSNPNGQSSPYSSRPTIQRLGTPERHKNTLTQAQSEILSLKRPNSRSGNSPFSHQNRSSTSNIKGSSSFESYDSNSSKSSKNACKGFFPRLEVLVLSHNGISGIEDLHLHALPSLRTVVLNCNRIKSFEGLENLSTVRAIVLDNNHITNVPFSCMLGCKSLRYLHLEHNRIAALPRFPNIVNLAALYLGYNRIQSLTDISCLANLDVQELTLIGNPSCKAEYWKHVVCDLPNLQKLDGVNLFQLRLTQETDPNQEYINIKLQSRDSSDWEDLEDIPPGYIPYGGLRVQSTTLELEDE